MFLEKTPSAKKLKPFFDLTVKPKHRFVSLKAFISSNEVDHKEIVSFFKANHKLVIDLVVDGFSGICERIKTEGEYGEKFRGAEGFAKHMFVVELLGWMIKLAPLDLIKSERISDVVNVIRILLIPGNDRIVRASGMHLLLAWLLNKDRPSIILTLFGSAICLKEFCGYIQQEPFPMNLDEAPLIVIF